MWVLRHFRVKPRLNSSIFKAALSTALQRKEKMPSDHELVSELVELRKTNKKLVRSSKYQAPSDFDLTICSWRTNEFQYYKTPSPLPTLARGLFTIHEGKMDEEDESTGRHRIVARGYDKFFNIGEVPWCTWDALKQHTTAPYVMTLKSNGCIIFIAALSPITLLVTSKHSLGPVRGEPLSHAQAGEKWLLKHLEKKGKSSEQLAHILWDNKWTAVAELCDDSFEEHVLSYSPEKTGLHLHGINESTGVFTTMPSDKVAEFASEWGFIETPYHTVNSIEEVITFSDQVSKRGQWNGEPIEGFVVRCHVSQDTPERDRSAPPYSPGSSFFFKIKFDEPYMMYRDWREITKCLLSAKDRMEEVSIPKAKLNRPESKLYLEWVRNEIVKDRSQFNGFNKGKAIIATRERFLDYMRSEEDNQRQDQLVSALGRIKTDGKHEKQLKKTIIMPIAIPGCGKTTVAVALMYLFGFGHIQSDDVRAKKSAPIFIKNVVNELETHDVVIADKNNHLKRHRQDLQKAVQNMELPVRLMALNWAINKPPAMVHRICADRVMNRGDNHQTLRADIVDKYHEDVIWSFLESREEFSDSEADEVIEMDIEDNIEQSLECAVDSCVRILGLQRPSQEDIGHALAEARGYTAQTWKEGKRRIKMGEIRYYGLLPEVDLEATIQARLAIDGTPDDVRKFWKGLLCEKCVVTTPHITLVHKNNLPDAQKLWDDCQKLASRPKPPVFSIRLAYIVSDGRTMAIVAEDLKPATNPGEDTDMEAIEFVASLANSKRDALHITVGTREKTIAAFEALSMVQSWRRGKAAEDVHALPLLDTTVIGRIGGLKR